MLVHRRLPRLQPSRQLALKKTAHSVIDESTGTEWIRNPRTLALWIQTGRDPQQVMGTGCFTRHV